MTGIEASTSPPALPRWFGPRASTDDPAVSALIDRVARGAGWADIGGGFNLNLRIDAEPPVVLRVHRPWVRRGRVAGLRRLRERLQRTQVRVARPIPISGCDLLRVADRWAELEEFIDHVQPRADEDSYVRLFEELGRVHTALWVCQPGLAPPCSSDLAPPVATARAGKTSSVWPVERLGRGAMGGGCGRIDAQAVFRRARVRVARSR